MAEKRIRSIGRRPAAGSFRLRPRRERPPARAAKKQKVQLQFRWAEAISSVEWDIYRTAMRAMNAAHVPFMLGGGFALATFMGRWRNTKDIDFYIEPSQRQAAIAALKGAGFGDYFSRLPYDRNWIYRSVKTDVIVDIIWSMANQRAQVDELWFRRAGSLNIRGEQLQVLPQEEFMWCKLYILQRDHCDWTDLFNLLYANGPNLDWGHLIQRVDEDIDLLRAMLTAYTWLCPARAQELPASLWKRLKMAPPRRRRKPPSRDRIHLLDSRCWFAALQPEGGKLEV